MPKFMGIHTLPPGGFTHEQLNQFAQVAQQDATVRGHQSFANLSESRAVCILEAPNTVHGSLQLCRTVPVGSCTETTLLP